MINITANGTLYYAKIFTAGLCGGYLGHKYFIIADDIKVSIISGIFSSVFIGPVAGEILLDTKFMNRIIIDEPRYITLESSIYACSFIVSFIAVPAFKVLSDAIGSYISDWSKKRKKR